MLFEDETILRFYPPLRAAWALRGEQATVFITGENAKRVLFGAINPRTGHRVVLIQPAMRQECFHAFLRELRRCYPRQPICLLLDKASAHEAGRSRALAERLRIELVWLPKQWSELNAMDQLWRGVKQNVSANHQYRSIDEHAQFAANWVRALTNTEALRKAGILSPRWWLKFL